MRFAGTESWRFAHNIDARLHFMLYLRDALALKVEDAGDPPALAGGIPDHSSLLTPGAAGAAAIRWTAWWHDLVQQAASAQLEPPSTRVDPQRWLLEMAARQELIYDPPEWRSLADNPSLREAARAIWAESHEWFQEARTFYLPPTGQDVFAWEQVRAGAERAAVEHRVPPGAVNGCAQVLLVEGSWWRLVMPGVALCSITAARDTRTVPSILKAVFDSYLAG